VDRAIGRRLCAEKVAEPAKAEIEGVRGSRRLGRERERGIFEDVHRLDRGHGRADIAWLRRHQRPARAGNQESEPCHPKQADHGGTESAIGHQGNPSKERGNGAVGHLQRCPDRHHGDDR
jgi:hypothetical protein